MVEPYCEKSLEEVTVATWGPKNQGMQMQLLYQNFFNVGEWFHTGIYSMERLLIAHSFCFIMH